MGARDSADLTGSDVLQVPSSVTDLRNPATRADIDRHVESPASPPKSALSCSSSRGTLSAASSADVIISTRMFYAGTPFVAKSYAYRIFGYEELLADDAAFLAS